MPEALGVAWDLAAGVRWRTQMQMPRLAKFQRPADAIESGALTDRHVDYDRHIVGKDPIFPKIGGFQPVRAQLSLFPSRSSSKHPVQPALISRINVILKESGLFSRELGAGHSAGNEQSEASRARLDVLRVAFAMYSDQATVYRPFLGMVQRVRSCFPLAGRAVTSLKFDL